jgi:hypothetical protein
MIKNSVTLELQQLWQRFGDRDSLGNVGVPYESLTEYLEFLSTTSPHLAGGPQTPSAPFPHELPYVPGSRPVVSSVSCPRQQLLLHRFPHKQQR